MPDAELDARTSLLTDDERAMLEHRGSDFRVMQLVFALTLLVGVAGAWMWLGDVGAHGHAYEDPLMVLAGIVGLGGATFMQRLIGEVRRDLHAGLAETRTALLERCPLPTHRNVRVPLTMAGERYYADTSFVRAHAVCRAPTPITVRFRFAPISRVLLALDTAD